MQLLVIDTGSPAGGSWELSGYAPTVLPDVDAGTRALGERGWDCVVLCVGAALPDARAVAALRQACDDTEVAMVVAGDGAREELTATLAMESRPPDLRSPTS